MAEKKRIGLREVRALGPNQIIWDSGVSGFHARRQRGPGVTYAVFYRTAEGRQRWHKIGRHGAPWTPEEAREEAVRILGRVAHGTDPAAERVSARKAKTVAELCDLYLADAEARSEEHTSELQSRRDLVCRLLLEKKKCIRKHVCGGRQNRNNDVGDKHGDSTGYFAIPTIF